MQRSARSKYLFTHSHSSATASERKFLSVGGLMVRSSILRDSCSLSKFEATTFYFGTKIYASRPIGYTLRLVGA